MRKDYTRFVTLVNIGARQLGYADTGELWRAGYDMPPPELAKQSDRLWNQVKPLYEQLHCYARGKLDAQYGKDKGELPSTWTSVAPCNSVHKPNCSTRRSESRMTPSALPPRVHSTLNAPRNWPAPN